MTRRAAAESVAALELLGVPLGGVSGVCDSAQNSEPPVPGAGPGSSTTMPRLVAAQNPTFVGPRRQHPRRYKFGDPALRRTIVPFAEPVNPKGTNLKSTCQQVQVFVLSLWSEA